MVALPEADAQTNQAPVLDPITSKTAIVGKTLAFNVTATDDGTDPLLYSISPILGTIDQSTGYYVFTPSINHVGIHTVTFTVSDGTLSHSLPVSITVGTNADPILTPIGILTAHVDRLLAYTVTATDADTSDMLRYSISSGPGNINVFKGIFTWQPNIGQIGTHTTTIRVEDGRGGFASEEVSIHVRSPNIGPSLTHPGDRTVAINEQITITLSATDADNDQLSYLTFSDIGTLTGDTFTWTPTRADIGSHKITFTVHDHHGGIESKTVTIKVVESITPNQTPILEPIGDKTTSAGKYLKFDLKATDAENDRLTYSKSSDIGTISSIAWTYVPTSAYFYFIPTGDDVGKSYDITFTVTDSNGGTDSEDVRITVNGPSPALPQDIPVGDQVALEKAIKACNTYSGTDQGWKTHPSCRQLDLYLSHHDENWTPRTNEYERWQNRNGVPEEPVGDTLDITFNPTNNANTVNTDLTLGHTRTYVISGFPQNSIDLGHVFVNPTFFSPLNLQYDIAVGDITPGRNVQIPIQPDGTISVTVTLHSHDNFPIRWLLLNIGSGLGWSNTLQINIVNTLTSASSEESTLGQAQAQQGSVQPTIPTIDPALIAKVQSYVDERQHGAAHVEKWTRVLAALELLIIMIQ